MKLNEPYFRNFWGKKFTTYATIFFVLLLIWVIYRHCKLGVPFGGEVEKQKIEQSK